MKEISTGKTMTIKEVAAGLGVSYALVIKRVNELFPNKVQNGKITYLNENEATAISLRIKENSSLITSFDDRKRLSQTTLEKKLLIKQGYDLLMQEVSNLQEENKLLKVKADVADQIADSTGMMNLTSVGKQVNGHPQKFCDWLVKHGILYRQQKTLLPYQPFQDRGYFAVKTTTNQYQNKSYYQTYFTPKGVAWVTALYLKKKGI